jgi:hypothetical protein
MKELITKLLESIKVDIIEDQQSKGIKASGKSMASLSVQNVTETGGELVGASYFHFQIYGRGPTKSGSGKGEPLRVRLIQWIKDKGITPDGISIKSLAFLIARKIHQKGTDIFLGERPGLYVFTIFDKQVKAFESEVQQTMYAKIREQLWPNVS